MSIAVSIIVPVYNAGLYLQRSLDSLCNQTLNNIEIICINDYSTDNSLDILSEYAAKDERILLINLEKNFGVSTARNKGLDIAKGEFLSFIDPDDYIDTNFCEILYHTAKKEDMDIVKTEIKRYEFDGTISKSRLNTLAIRDNNRFYFVYEWQTAIYKNSLVKENNIRFNQSIPTGQDWVFQVQCILATHKVFFITDSTYYHYIRRDNSLNSLELDIDKIKSKIYAISLILKYINEANLELENELAYIGIHRLFLEHSIDSLLIRQNANESIEIIARCLVNSFENCKRKDLLNTEFKYNILLSSINAKDIDKLILELIEFKSAYSQTK